MQVCTEHAKYITATQYVEEANYTSRGLHLGMITSVSCLATEVDQSKYKTPQHTKPLSKNRCRPKKCMLLCLYLCNLTLMQQGNFKVFVCFTEQEYHI